MKNIVHEKNSSIFVTLGDVAQFSGNDIRYTKELIQKYSKEFKLIDLDMDSVSFKGLKPLKLSEVQVNFLLMLMRNSKNVIKFKLALSVQIEKLKDKIRISHEKEVKASRISFLSQLKQKDIEIEKAERRGYAHLRKGRFQCVTNIINSTKSNVSANVLNKILLKENIIDEREIVSAKYIGNNVESIDFEGQVLVDYDTVVRIMDEYGVNFKEDDQMKWTFN